MGPLGNELAASAADTWMVDGALATVPSTGTAHVAGNSDFQSEFSLFQVLSSGYQVKCTHLQ